MRTKRTMTAITGPAGTSENIMNLNTSVRTRIRPIMITPTATFFRNSIILSPSFLQFTDFMRLSLINLLLLNVLIVVELI